MPGAPMTFARIAATLGMTEPGPARRRCQANVVRQGFPEPSMGMGRVGLVIGFWFVFWMVAGAVVGALTAGYHGGIQNGIYYGAFNGAIFAFIASFAWPWIMPESLERWMDRGGA